MITITVRDDALYVDLQNAVKNVQDYLDLSFSESGHPARDEWSIRVDVGRNNFHFDMTDSNNERETRTYVWAEGQGEFLPIEYFYESPHDWVPKDWESALSYLKAGVGNRDQLIRACMSYLQNSITATPTVGDTLKASAIFAKMLQLNEAIKK